MRLFLLGIYSFFSCLFAHAQTSSPYALKLRDGIKEPVPNIDAISWPRFMQSQYAIFGKVSCLFQFESRPNADQVKQLRSIGVAVGEYVDAFSYQVLVSGDPGWERLRNLGLRAAFVLSPTDKLSPDIFSRRYPSWALRGPGSLDVWVQFLPQLNLSQVEQLLQASGFSIRNARFAKHHWVEISIDTNRLVRLAALPFVEYVQPGSSNSL